MSWKSKASAMLVGALCVVGSEVIWRSVQPPPTPYLFTAAVTVAVLSAWTRASDWIRSRGKSN